MSTGGPSDRHQAFAAGSGGRSGNPSRHTHTSGAGGGKSGEPPNLALFSNSPVYDLATVVQLVGVRPMILWGWEQHLGIPAPTRVNEEAGAAVRRYSERDLVASLWLRDQILDGVSPPDAAARLRAAAHPDAGDEEPWGASDSGLRRGRVNTGPLPDSFAPQRAPKYTRPLTEYERIPSIGLGAAERMDSPRSGFGEALGGASSGIHSAPPSQSQVWVSPLSGPLGDKRMLSDPSGSIMSGPIDAQVMPGARSGQLSTDAVIGPVTSGPLPSPRVVPGMYSPPNSGESTARSMPWGVTPGSGVSTSTRGRELRTLMPQLLRAFANFDTLGANHILEEALSTRSVETVCVTLLQPALARVGDLWASHHMTVPEEHFASNYVRGLLFSLLHQTPERIEAPMVFVSCGPREVNDVHALVLAVFLRRAGLRVIYLGQDMPGADLVEEVRRRRPAMLALSISSSQRIRSLARVGKAIGQLDAPRPTFVFSGPIFVRNPELQNKLASHGLYLGDDLGTATYHAMKLLGMDTSTRR